MKDLPITTADCCTPTTQETCCAPEAKQECCGESRSAPAATPDREPCGCSAGHVEEAKAIRDASIRPQPGRR